MKRKLYTIFMRPFWLRVADLLTSLVAQEGMVTEPQQGFSGIGAQLQQIWRSADRRPGRRLPFWRDFKAENIAPAMKEIWVLEYQPDDAMIVRFMGSSIVHWAGRDTTGKDFLEHRIAPEHRKMMMGIYRTTYETPCATCLTRLMFLPGKNLKEMRTTFFPLHFDEGGKWGLLGCSEMRTAAEEDPSQMEGSADFAGAKLLPPRFVDLGFGLPPNQPDDPDVQT